MRGYHVDADELADDREVVNVYTWRLRELERAGYELASASLLAADPDIDLHDAIELVRRGCPPETAARILL